MPYNAMESFAVLFWGASILFGIVYELIYGVFTNQISEFIEKPLDLLKIPLFLYGCACTFLGGRDFFAIQQAGKLGSFWSDLWHFLVTQLPHAPGTSILTTLFTFTGWLFSHIPLPQSPGILHFALAAVALPLAFICAATLILVVGMLIAALLKAISNEIAIGTALVLFGASLLYSIGYTVFIGFHQLLQGDVRGIVLLLLYPSLIYINVLYYQLDRT